MATGTRTRTARTTRGTGTRTLPKPPPPSGPAAGAARTPGRWLPRRSDRCYRASRWPTRCVLTRCRITSGRARPWARIPCCARSWRPTKSPRLSCGGRRAAARPAMFIEDKAVDTLAYLSDGDARAGLNGLQLAVLARLSSRKMFCKKSGQSYSPSRVLITENDVKEGLQRSHILYDRAGEEHYNCISALHKSMRGSDQNASLYWLARMLEGGEDPLYVARRLVRFASEDIGLADPSALTQAVAAYQGCHFIGMPECEVLLAQCVVYFARAPKSIEVYSAYNNVKACLRNHQGPLPPVPLHLRNAPTRLMKDLGYGKGYKYNPMYSEPVDQEYLPEELRGVDFFKQRRC
ncbi:ATPase WRNIP1 isoform X3 [Homo sapiens]|uniref:ATPase WRNIP1 isoform X3 n=1 Tax=Homo sapiens TaxID=9606 RepID=UPI0023DF65DF|nr:ATPase WRNIP1 isoform X3 [Homo sapiens]